MAIPRDNSTIPLRVKSLEQRLDELSRRRAVISDDFGVPRDMILLNDVTVPAVQTDVSTINNVTIPAIQTDAATTKTTADTALAKTTDGLPPASSPAAEVIGGLGVLFIRWPPVANANPVTYKVYVATTTGFTEGAGNLVAQTGGTSITVRTLTAGTALAYGTTYYAKIVASDADGSAAAGAEGSGSMLQVNSPDIAANAVSATQIAGDAIDGKVITGAKIRTAATGKRWELTSDFFSKLLAYSGDPLEVAPGGIEVNTAPSLARVWLTPPNLGGAGQGAYVRLSSDSTGVTPTTDTTIGADSISLAGNSEAGMHVGAGHATVDAAGTIQLLTGSSTGIILKTTTTGGIALVSGGPVTVNSAPVVTLTDAQTLTNKTLTNPAVSGVATVAGEIWHEVGNATTGLGTTLATSYTNFGSGYPTLRFYKDATGAVWIVGRLTWGGAATTTVGPFTLPSGYRPTVLIPCMARTNASPPLIIGVNVNPDGTIGYVNSLPAGAQIFFALSFPTF